MEFQVEDVEAEFARLKDDVEVVCEPKMMPWGNRAAQVRDPEGDARTHVYPRHRSRKEAVWRPLSVDMKGSGACQIESDTWREGLRSIFLRRWPVDPDLGGQFRLGGFERSARMSAESGI